MEVTHIAKKLPDEPRVNEEITAAEVLVIDNDGTKLGVMTPAEGIAAAEERELDLVEVAPDGKPPVCRILDFGKYRYQQQKKEKEAKKKQKSMQVKEIRLSTFIEDHDIATKSKTAAKFLKDGDKVKVSLRFRGRERDFVSTGQAVMQKFAENVSEVGVIEKAPKFEGRNLTMFLAPKADK